MCLKSISKHSTVINSPLCLTEPLPNIPLPATPSNDPTPNGNPGRPVPRPRPQQREKKIYIAAYDYKPFEAGDLELVTVSPCCLSDMVSFKRIPCTVVM